MIVRFVEAITKVCFLFSLFLLLFQPIFAQDSCLSDEKIQQLREKLISLANVQTNQNLRKELLKMKANIINNFQRNSREDEQSILLNLHTGENSSRLKTLTATIEKERQINERKVCEMLRENGWLSKSMVGEDGASALFYLLKNVVSPEIQLQLFPLINEAAKKNETPKTGDYAAFVDRLRLNLGLNQIFGTQVYEENDFLILPPIQSMENIDLWRKEYKMNSLKEYLKFLEMNYRMPVKISHSKKLVNSSSVSKEEVLSKDVSLGIANDEEEIIKVGTNLVNLNLRVLSKDLISNVGDFGKADFKVFENGREEKVEFFSKIETPFDLVLLIDLSGSTVSKQGLIRQAAKDFIVGLRSMDRASLVTFTDKIEMVSSLTSDQSGLLKSVNKIGGNGGSNIWDALEATIEKVFLEKTPNRRQAIVLLSDGFDDALQSIYGAGSKTSFGHLLESVRKSDVSIIPIYLDTEYKDFCGNNGVSGIPCNRYRQFFKRARKTLDVLAEESGGLMYQANRIEDLKSVYTEVLMDLRTIYSLGYLPTDNISVGVWRSINVEVVNHPNLVVRTKAGYYAQ